MLDSLQNDSQNKENLNTDTVSQPTEAMHFDNTSVVDPYEQHLLDLAIVCEECALALEDELDHRLALDALTTETVVMTSIPASSSNPVIDYNSQLAGHTQAFSTDVLNAVPSSSLNTHEPSAEEVAKHAKTKRTIALVVVLLTVLCLGGFGAYSFFEQGGFAMFEKVTHGMVESALQDSSEVLIGFADSEYVDDSAYTLSNVEIINELENDDGSVDVEVTYDLDNEFFHSDAEAIVHFIRVKDLQFHDDFQGIAIPNDAEDMDWISRIEITGNTTHAVAAITHDDDALGEFSPTFNEEDQSCIYTYTESTGSWLSSVENKYTYSYSFDGQRWTRLPFEGPEVAVSYLGIEGHYTPGVGDSGQFNSFRIYGLDSQAGTFTISYNKDASSLNNDAIYGEIYCTISREASSSNYADYAQEDGFVYSFTGTGTSSSGEGTSSIYGLFTTDNGFIFDFNGDYTYKPFIFGEEKNDSIALSGSFILG